MKSGFWIGCCLLLRVATADVIEAQANPATTTKVTAEGAELKLLSDDFQFTEGPAVDPEGNVFFTDQPNDRILRWSPSEGIQEWLKPAGRSNGLFFDRQGRLLACADERNELWRIDKDKKHEVLLRDFEGQRFNGPNDVWVADDGNIYFTDPFYLREYWGQPDAKPQLPKRVYRLAPDGSRALIVAEGFVQPNGIVGDSERQLLYIADIGDNKTYRFRITEDGGLTDRQIFCEMGSDGMTLDQLGNLYLTGEGVTVFNPDGEKIQTLAVPEAWTANVSFGGPKRQTLFITASDSFYSLQMRVSGLK